MFFTQATHSNKQGAGEGEASWQGIRVSTGIEEVRNHWDEQLHRQEVAGGDELSQTQGRAWPSRCPDLWATWQAPSSFGDSHCAPEMLSEDSFRVFGPIPARNQGDEIAEGEVYRPPSFLQQQPPDLATHVWESASHARTAAWVWKVSFQHTHAHTFVYIYTYIYIYVIIHTYTYTTYIYIYMYTCTHVYTCNAYLSNLSNLSILSYLILSYLILSYLSIYPIYPI